MEKISLHNHSNYSDGKNTLEEMCLSACEKGFSQFGLSDHVFCYDFDDSTLKAENYEKYIESANLIKKEYKNKMLVPIGMEVDYYKETKMAEGDISHIRSSLDYVIGSIHFISKNKTRYAIDYLPEIVLYAFKHEFNENPRLFVETYYNTYMEMLNDVRPQIGGHLDIIKKNNNLNLFNEKEDWYLKLVEDSVKLAKKLDVILEINTGGAFKYGLRCLYPTDEILQIEKHEEVKMTIGSDAHSIQMIDELYPIGISKLKEAGFNEIYGFSDDLKDFKKIKI